MAKNKDDDIASRVGGWLGGAAKSVQSWSESQARTFTNPYINAAGRAIGKNLNLPVSGAKEAITNTAFAAVDVASGPIGRVAAKGVAQVAKAANANFVIPKITTKIVPSQKRAFRGIQDEMIETGYFDQGHGGLNAIYDSRKFEDVIERGYLSPKQVNAINKEAKRMRDDSVYRNLENYKKRQRPK